MRKFLLTFFFLQLFVCSAVHGAEFNVNISKGSLHVGDKVEITLNLKLDKNEQINFEKTEKYLNKYFSILNKKQKKLTKGSQINYKIIYECLFFGTNDVNLKIPVKIKVNDKNTHLIYKQARIKFLPLVKEKANIKLLKDIKGPLFLKEKVKKLYLLITLVVFVLLILLIYLFARKIKAGKQKIENIIETPYWIDILRQIRALKGKEYSSFPEAKKLCYDLSMLLRKYIEKRFSISAPNKTTEEFMDFMLKWDALDEKQKKLLIDFLNLSDKAKYSGYLPTKKEIEDLVESAETFINETKPALVNDNKSENREVSKNDNF